MQECISKHGAKGLHSYGAYGLPETTFRSSGDREIINKAFNAAIRIIHRDINSVKVIKAYNVVQRGRVFV